MSFYSPKEVAAIAMHTGVAKSQASLPVLLVLGVMAGAFIALGFLLDIHVISSLPPAWGSFGVFLGASVFPVGLVLTVLAGGELLTGNMMTLPMALFSRQIGVLALIRNWFWVTLANFIGSLMMAWFFGHILGMTEGAFLANTVATAHAKISAGQATWHDYVINFPPVFLGNAVGGGIFVALIYFIAYRPLGGQSHA